MIITPPLVITEAEDIVLFLSSEDAERTLEPIDVERGSYTGYDSAGHRLLIRTDGRSVTIEALQDTHPQELQRILVRALRASGVEVDESTSMSELLRRSDVFEYHMPRNLGEILRDFVSRWRRSR